MTIPLHSARSNLFTALISNIVPDQEYLLQGSVLNTSLNTLLTKLDILCDNYDVRCERFHDLEMVYTIKKGSPPTDTLQLRVRKALDKKRVAWNMRYLGIPLIPDRTRPVIVRNCINVGTTNSVLEFLKEMGFKLDYEFIARGYMYKKGLMKITVTRILRKVQGRLIDSLQPLTNSYLVELSVIASRGQDDIADEMKLFAEQLQPLVQMDIFGLMNFY